MTSVVIQGTFFTESIGQLYANMKQKKVAKKKPAKKRFKNKCGCVGNCRCASGKSKDSKVKKLVKLAKSGKKSKKKRK